MKFLNDRFNRCREALEQARFQAHFWLAQTLRSLVPDWRTIVKTVPLILLCIYALFQPFALKYIAPFFGLSLAIVFFIKTRKWRPALLVFPLASALVLLPYWLMYRLAIPAIYDLTLSTYNQTEFGLMLVWGVSVAVGALTSTLIFRLASRRRLVLLGITWLILGSLSLAAWFANDSEELRTWQLATYVSSDVEVLEHMPPTVNRLLPQISAKGQIHLDNRSNLYVPGDKPHLSPGLDSKMYWCAPLYYKDELLYNVLGMVKDVSCIDSNNTDMEAAATTPQAGQDGFYEIVSRLAGVFETKPGDGFFWVGDRSFISNAVLHIRHPFSRKDRVIYTYALDGSRHYLMTYVSKCPYLMGAMLPCVGGVLDVNSSGLVSDLSIAEAEARYPRAVFVSEDFAATLIKAYARFYTGIVSKEFNQQSAGVMQMSMEERPKELALEDYNSAPYITEFKRELRPQQMASLEPAGVKDGKAITALVLVDNYGHLRIFKPAAGSGPAMAMTYAHNADPRVDWGHKILPEDRPVIGENDHIYWLVSVVNDNPRHPLYISSLVDSIHFTASAVHDARELDGSLKQLDGQTAEPAGTVPVQH